MISEAGHWYTAEGEPRYTVIGKDGKERPTTLREARKEGWLPSVTTVMQVMAKPGLQRWKDERLIDACMMYADKIPTEISCDYDFARIKAGEIARNAADEGTKIHAAIERFLQGKWIDTKYEAHVDAAIRELHKLSKDWPTVEKGFADEAYGYAGKIDLLNDEWVIDFKGKEFGEDDSIKAYDEHFMQLSAYERGIREGLEPRNQANIFISRSHPGVARTVIHTIEQAERGWNMFKACLELWQAQKRYLQ